MKVKQVNRYFCGFCDKKSLRAWSMEKHERHCTMNPARTCRVCPLIARWFPSESPRIHLTVPELQKLLDPPHWYANISVDEFAERIKPLREATGNCPACILSALRQQGITREQSYEYKDEVTELWARIDETEPVEVM